MKKIIKVSSKTDANTVIFSKELFLNTDLRSTNQKLPIVV